MAKQICDFSNQNLPTVAICLPRVSYFILFYKISLHSKLMSIFNIMRTIKFYDIVNKTRLFNIIQDR